MFRKFDFCSLALLLAPVLCGSAAGQGSLDRVFLAKGAPSQGIITEMGRDKVVLNASGVGRDFATNEIVQITYADEPQELTSARNSVRAKNYNQALIELRKLDAAPPARDVIKQDVAYLKAICLARLAMTEGGDKAAAIAAMRAFATSAPQNYHFYDVAETLGDLAVASGNNADAARFYTAIAKAPWGDFQLRGNNAIGRALMAEKQFDQAVASFDAVLASELATPEATQQKQMATVGKAVCQAETGKADQAVATLQDIIAKSDPQEAVLFARTYNALGRCYLKQNKTKEALLAFLHTDVMFSGDPEAHAEALFYLSNLWVEVNKRERADNARNTLQQRYAGSQWSNPNRKP
jgi:tetratricopeptide (TPR) repeat protein